MIINRLLLNRVGEELAHGQVMFLKGMGKNKGIRGQVLLSTFQTAKEYKIECLSPQLLRQCIDQIGLILKYYLVTRQGWN